VLDDGRDFDVEDVMADYSSRGSLGMVNMRERAQRVDGTVKVDAKPGRGTAVTVIVPLTTQNRREAQPQQ
jgi:signal transduction histidine kinase